MTNALVFLPTVSMKGLISEAPKAQFSPRLEMEKYLYFFLLQKTLIKLQKKIFYVITDMFFSVFMQTH